MNQIKLSTQQVTALVQSGFAPVFASLAKIMHGAVAAGAEQLYHALTGADVSLQEANRLYDLAGTAPSRVADDVLVAMLSEEVSLDAFPRVLQQAAELGAKELYAALDPSSQQKADNLFGNFFKPKVDPLHVDGPKGDMDFDDILDLFQHRRVKRFNYSENPHVAIDASSIVVRGAGNHPEYYFNERGAEDAVYDGERLSMPDAQGFSCTFEFA